MTDRLPRSVGRTRNAATGAGSFNTNRANGVANATGPNPSDRGGRRTSPPSGGDSIKVSDSSAAAGGPERRGPCTRDYETDERRTHRQVREDSRWEIHNACHSLGGQRHD